MISFLHTHPFLCGMLASAGMLFLIGCSIVAWAVYDNHRMAVRDREGRS